MYDIIFLSSSRFIVGFFILHEYGMFIGLIKSFKIPSDNPLSIKN